MTYEEMEADLKAEIKRLENDRDGWMNRFLARGEDLLRVQSDLAVMRAERDQAVMDAHLIHQQPTTEPDNKL